MEHNCVVDWIDEVPFYLVLFGDGPPKLSPGTFACVMKKKPRRSRKEIGSLGRESLPFDSLINPDLCTYSSRKVIPVNLLKPALPQLNDHRFTVDLVLYDLSWIARPLDLRKTWQH
jgi:hypothetical protein